MRVKERQTSYMTSAVLPKNISVSKIRHKNNLICFEKEKGIRDKDLQNNNCDGIGD